MKKHMKTLALAGLLSAFCLVPLSSAQARGPEMEGRHQANHQRAQYHKARHHKAKHHKARHHKAKRHVRRHRKMEHARHVYRHPRHRRIIRRRHAPRKVIYVYKRYDDDYRDKLIAVTLAQTALLLALD